MVYWRGYAELRPPFGEPESVTTRSGFSLLRSRAGKNPIYFPDEVLYFQVTIRCDLVFECEELLHQFTKTVNVGARDAEAFNALHVVPSLPQITCEISGLSFS
jgi:hypothetical protein